MLDATKIAAPVSPGERIASLDVRRGFAVLGILIMNIQSFAMIGVWALQLIVSSIWLRHLQFGPAEWLWRSLTYGKIQPMPGAALRA